jgi:SAM-dependent methyltransferase
VNSYHNVEWTPERIERFWNHYSTNAAARGTYFSSQFGSAIVRLVRRRVRLTGTLVDQGCGRGDLIEVFLRQGFPCKAIDSSAQAVDRVRERFARHPVFRGGSVGPLDSIPLLDGEAGAVFLIEVLEHLSPDDAARAFAELRRVIQPGGHLIVTVPNEEDLDAKAVACPECGCVFHRMQHVQRFDPQSLARLITGFGFEAVFVRSVNLKDYAGNGLTGAIGVVRRATRAFRRRPNPHLMAVGRRLPACSP